MRAVHNNFSRAGPGFWPRVVIFAGVVLLAAGTAAWLPRPQASPTDTGRTLTVTMAGFQPAVLEIPLGFVLGLAFTMLLTVVVPGLAPNLTLQVSGASLLKVGVVSLVIAALAAVLPIRQIAGLDPATVFRGK